MNDKSPIGLEDENELTVEDILKNKNIYLRGEYLKLFVDNNFIVDIDMKKEDPLKILIEKYSANLPKEFDFIDKEQRQIKREDAMNDEEILIEDILTENKINIATKKVNEKKDTISNDKMINEKQPENSQQKIMVNISINNEVKAIKKLKGEAKLSEVRKILSDIMGINAYFLMGEIKITDEDDFCLKDIIKDNSIYILDESLEQIEKNKGVNLFDNNISGSNEKNEGFKIMTIIENGKKIKTKKNKY